MLIMLFGAATANLKPGQSVEVRNSEGASFTVGIHPDGTHYANSNNEKARLLIERSLAAEEDLLAEEVE
jgi:hypothetical protein